MMPMQHFKTGDFSGFKAGLQRLAAAMNGVPDRVPICAQMHEFAMRELRADARDFYTSTRFLPAGYLSVLAAYGIDVPGVEYDVYNIEAEAIGQRIVYSDRHMPDVDRSAPLICSARDLFKIRTPDFNSDGRLRTVVEMYAVYRDLLGEEPVLNFCAPFSLAANIRGTERLLMDIMLQPDFARELFDRITDALLIPWIMHLKQAFPGAHSICGSDATASIPIVNAAMLADWVVPWIDRLRRICGKGVYVPNWVGERYLRDPEIMLDLKRKVCPAFLEGQDPDVAAIGPAVYRQYADQCGVPLMLGIGAGFLALTTPAEIEKRVRTYIEEGGPAGRFVLYLCNVGATTPRENIRAAVSAARRYGSYQVGC